MRTLVSLVLVALVACSDAPDAGESCTLDAECPSDTRCLGVGEGDLRLCLPSCDPAVTVLCDVDAHGLAGVCVALDEGGACHPGGGVEVGELCESTAQCVQGALCVLDGGLGTCRVACDLASPDCGAGETCASLGAGTRGYCVPAP